MKLASSFIVLTLSLLLSTACGGSKHGQKHKAALARPTTVVSATPIPPIRQARQAPLAPDEALVTAERENRVLVVELPSGRVVESIGLPRDPEDIAAAPPAWGKGRLAVVTSAAAGDVTLLEGRALRPVKRFGAFSAPHIVELMPVVGGFDAYVTDDARGTLSVIDLSRQRVTSTIHVGPHAHHLGLDLIHETAWVGLGESARAIVILSTENPARPRVIGRLEPGFDVHDLSFSSDGLQAWITSANRREVTVLDGIDEQVLFRVPVGPPPQHVALAGRWAYLTSGYGGVIEQVDAATGRIVARARSPYGSFELAADGRYVVTSSLLRGTLAIYTAHLKLLRVVHLAPATREVALSSPAGTQP